MADQPAAKPTNFWDVLKWFVICACIVIILIVVLANVMPPPPEPSAAPAPATAQRPGANPNPTGGPASVPSATQTSTTGGGAPASSSGSQQPASTTGKKGFVVGNDDPSGAGKVAALNAKWYYTWGATPSTPPASVPFTPMFWNVVKQAPKGASATEIATKAAQTLTQLKTLNVAGQENILLAYNEPDGQKDAQANMTVGQAVEYWPQLVATGRRLGSPVMYGSTTEVPATPNPNNVPASGFTTTVELNLSNKPGTSNIVTLDPANIWLDNFLVQISNLNPIKFPDFICIHWYGEPKASSFTNYLTAVYNKYKLPIWVTEYSCADWKATCCPNNATQHTAGYDWSVPTNENISTNATAQFMRDTISFMNSSSFVERFSWKERFLLGNPDGTPPGADEYMTPEAVPKTTQGGPDFMNQSALFMSYKHFPTALPPLTPLGQLYASL